LQDIQWKASIEKTQAGVLPEAYVTNPIFIYNNDIRFYDILDSSSVFYEASTGLRILLEKAYLRDASNDNWLDSLAYSIYPDSYLRMDASTSRTITVRNSYTILSGTGTIKKGKVTTSFNDLTNPTSFTVDNSCYIIADTSTVIQTPFFVNYIIESSTGVKWTTDGFANLRPDTSSFLQYAFDINYKAPLLSMKNYKFTDASENVITFDKTYFLDILDGKISMRSYIPEPSSFTSDPSTIYYKKEEYYINWNYDTSLAEQKITLNVVYSSPRAPLYIYDPSIYYHSGADNALVLDNRVYVMDVNHIGDYQVEVFGWDYQNNTYRNFMRTPYPVWTKFPIIWSYIDTSCISGSLTICPSAMLSVEDISTLASENLNPVFDRTVPLQGLTLEQDVDGKYYIKVPSISYFVDLPTPRSIARFYNMTERIVTRVDDIFTVDPDFQSFYSGDLVNIVLFDKGKYNILAEVSGNISSVSGNDLTILGIPVEFVTDSSTEVYLLNDTQRITCANSVSNDLINKTLSIDISLYSFGINQLVGMIIDDISTGYSWGSSFRVLDVSLSADPSSCGYYTHLLSGNIPEFILADPSRYTITAKHAFSSFADFSIDVSNAFEQSNQFNIYIDDYYFHQYYLDNTFVYVNVLFDQERVVDQWFDPSTDGALVTGPYYPRTNSITIEPSTLVILDTFYDPSNYILGQKNIWTVKEKTSDQILFRVFNKQVPFIFTDPGIWDVQVESYDKFGNLKTQYYEGLIIVKDV